MHDETDNKVYKLLERWSENLEHQTHWIVIACVVGIIAVVTVISLLIGAYI